jgi:serine/threonine protein kinase
MLLPVHCVIHHPLQFIVLIYRPLQYIVLLHHPLLATLQIIDFGLALDMNLDPPTSRVGTLHYMAPELQGQVTPPGAPLAERVDCWAVGVIAWELMSGRLPFTHESRNCTRALIVEGIPPWKQVRLGPTPWKQVRLGPTPWKLVRLGPTSW